MALALKGDRARLVCSAGQLELEVDRKPAENATAVHVLTSQAGDLGDDYIVDARRLDENMWEVNAFSTAT